MTEHHGTWAYRASRYRILTSRIILGLILLLLILLPPSWDRGTPLGLLVGALGVQIIALGALMRILASLYISGRRTKELVREGPYAMVRHPLYVGSFLITVGVGLYSAHLTFLVALVLAFLCYYVFVIRYEEADMIAHHGEAYRTFQQETPALLPRLSRYREPETQVVTMRRVRRFITEAMAAFGGVLLVELVELVRASGVLPG